MNTKVVDFTMFQKFEFLLKAFATPTLNNFLFSVIFFSRFKINLNHENLKIEIKKFVSKLKVFFK